MGTAGKILVTVFLIFIFFVIAGFLNVAGGGGKAFTGLLALGLFFGIKGMWKKPKQEKSTEIKLDKTLNSENKNNITK